MPDEEGRLDSAEIIAAVDAHEIETSALRERFDADYSLYRLEEYDAGADFASYTSNEPMTYVDKIVGWLSTSETVIRIPHRDSKRQKREQDTAKELFTIGILNSADERLIERLQPPFKEQLAWYIPLRGWYAVRALLRKKQDGSTFVDITPWDPLHTFWGVGPDGLAWACYKASFTRAQIRADYGVDLPGDLWRDTDAFDVYDFYDDQDNTVVIQELELKPRTPHGSPRVPVAIGMVGAMPMIQTDVTDKAIEDFGESALKAIREINDSYNLMMSVTLELAQRSREPPLAITSRDGSKTLAENPYKTGSEIALAEGDKVEPLKLLETTKDVGALVGLISGEMQRGGLPHSVYGDLQFALSGFAINTLRQGVDTQVRPRIKAMERAILQVVNLVFDQYMTGAFDVLTLSGMAMNRDYFNAEFEPQVLHGAGDLEISIVATLPQDDNARMGMAQIAREGPTPLLPDVYIRDRILSLQDADEIEDTIKEQLAERGLPEAQLWVLMEAAENRGRTDLAQFYFSELMQLMAQKMGLMFPAPVDANGAQPTNGTAGPGTDPRVLPNASLGVPPPTPTPQAGALVPPGQPRPGAQSDESRLNNIGLVLGR